MIRLENNVLYLETATQKATMENGRLTSLVSKATKKTYLQASGDAVGTSLLWVNRDRRKLDTGTVEVRLINDNRAQFVFHSWYGDGVTQVWCDDATGDIMVCPNASSGRMGVKAVEWEISGIDMSLKAVVPTCQGVKLSLDDPLLAGSFYAWPQDWEIGLCVFEGNDGDGFWVHCRDTKFIYKDIRFGKDDTLGSVTFSTQAYGPLDHNKSAGGLVWRVNCFEGGWRVPAKIYKDWYWNAYDLTARKAARLDWMDGVTMSVCWANTDTECLDALAKMVDPRRVLIHFSDWRDFKYDQDYPEYVASEKAAKYLRHGAELGFHIAPHMNSKAIDPSHAVYRMLADFQELSADDQTVHGWGFDEPNWQSLGVPWTEAAKTDPKNRDFNIMAMIHAGSTLWQSELSKRIQQLAKDNPIDSCFIDQTLCAYNLHNCLVDGKTLAEGMRDLIGLISETNGGLAVCGEGCNEIIAQTQSFGMMHLYRSGHFNCEGLERTGGDCAINHFIYGELCKTIGYYRLAGRNEEELLRGRMHEEHGALPTIITNDPQEILHPNAYVAGVFERANH